MTRLFAYPDSEYTDIRRVLSPDIVVVFTRGICTIKGRNYLEQKIKEIA